MKGLSLFVYMLSGLLGLGAGATQAQQRVAVSGLTTQIDSASSSALQKLAPVQVYAAPQVSVEAPIPLPDADLFQDRDPGKSLSERFADSLAFDLSYVRDAAQRVSSPAAVRPSQKPVVFSSLNSNVGWSLGAENWRLRRSDGLNVALGSGASKAPDWGNSARLGGIALSRSLSDGMAAEGEWQYSVALGALDYSRGQGTSGALVYGPTASDSLIRYGVTRDFTLETQMQAAPDLMVVGVGGEYSLQEWGAWSAGVAKASHQMSDGWRYRVGYDVSLFDTLELSWVNEQRSGGFTDLTRYRNFSVDAGRQSNQWAATLPMGRWGDLRGSYEEVGGQMGLVKQTFGLTQQFWYSPNLRIAIKADRELISGDYGVALRFSLPIH
jgi:hypothetical protein